ncbi:MAG TPA: hypothetical protein VGJ20_07495 [Xanthobacteraceae bacterium]|jgi:hypothetical protein
MNRISPRAVVTALLLLGIGSPGFAQSSYHSYRIHHARQHNAAIRQNGLNSLALVPSIGGDASAPTLTGGGSVGYNANLLKDE